MKQQHPLDVKAKPTRGTRQRKLGKDGTTWTPTELYKRNKALKQFCKFGRKGVAVSSGTTPEFQSGWDLAFGTASKCIRCQRYPYPDGETTVAPEAWVCDRCLDEGVT